MNLANFGNVSAITGQARQWWKQDSQCDLMASAVVFMVALPLCMGIALAAGASPIAGLLGGIIGGIVVGSLGGNPLQVSGPANGLIVVVALCIAEHGLETLGLVVLMAGAMQVAAGALKIGQWFRAVTPAVILGLLTGFAVIIFASQVHVMLDDQPHSSVISNLVSIPIALQHVIVPESDSNRHVAGWLGLATITVLLGWPKLAPPRLKVLPASLMAVVLATLLAQVIGLNVARVQLPDQLWNAIAFPQIESLSTLFNGELWVIAMTIAFIASAESLLSAAALDQMHSGERTKYDRELLAQGIGNMLCGAVGALPSSGVIVRSATNLQAGARTRMSAVLHGVWMLLFILMLPWILRMIPTASLAAVLVVTVCKLVKPKDVRAIWAASRGEFIIYVATSITIVTVGVLPGVLLGLAMSLIKLLYTFVSRFRVWVDESPVDGQCVLHMEGAATFASLPAMARALDRFSESDTVVVDTGRLWFVDHACFEALLAWSRQHECRGGCVEADWTSLLQKCQGPKPAPKQTTPSPVVVIVGNNKRRLQPEST